MQPGKASSEACFLCAGDVKLSDLKAALARAGVPSEWEGPGTLLAARGRVRVRLAGGARAGGECPILMHALSSSGLRVDVHFTPCAKNCANYRFSR